jgi:hypothetical protein
VRPQPFLNANAKQENHALKQRFAMLEQIAVDRVLTGTVLRKRSKATETAE